MDDFVEFVDKSMITRELAKHIGEERKYCDELQTKYDDMNGMMSALRTPLETCKRYNEIKALIPMTANKRRKELERELNGLVDQYKTCMTDAEYIRKMNGIRSDIDESKSKQTYLDSFSRQHVTIICDILEEQGFINKGEENTYTFTNRGRCASGVAEIHPLVLADCINDWFGLSTKQIVGLFSCFTDVKVDEDSRSSIPMTSDQALKQCILTVESTFHKYEDIERARRTDPAYNYHNPLMFDMTDYMMEWCDCANEDDCKIFLDKITRICSVGDFTKAIMKISAIVKELTTVCEQNEYTDFMYKLSTIDSLILKYVATTQSLYI
jgi:hypothetical protein